MYKLLRYYFRIFWTLGVVSLPLLLWLVTVFYSLPSNVVNPRVSDGKIRDATILVAPQSWPFFTKAPNDVEYTAYKIHGTEIVKISRFPNARVENHFGISRDQRAQGPEMANLASQIPDDKWVDCSKVFSEDCLVYTHETSEKIRVDNNLKVPSMCGELLLVVTEPVNFHQAHKYNGWRHEISATRLAVSC